MWREDRISELLSDGDAPVLYVSGTVSTRAASTPFDAVVLLSAPAEVLLPRIDARTTNPYGKAESERELILTHIAEVEPLLRATCTHEIDATQSLDLVVQRLVEIGVGA